MQKVWQIVEEKIINPDIIGTIRDLHPVAASMLARRKILNQDEAEVFLNPNWSRDVHDPFLFVNMRVAVERIFRAVQAGEHIIIYGDYDADGVTSSVMMAEAIKMLVKAMALPKKIVDNTGRELDEKFFNVLKADQDGLDLDIYIPHREKEGYGLNMESVKLITDRGAKLLITVDCGIANAAEIACACELGIETIVVDHHQFGEALPEAILIHPKLSGEDYPFKDLAAVGVAWKLACGLAVEARTRGLKVPDGWEKWQLDLVSIATVTDIVPLQGENRALEKYGLLVLNKMRRPAFRALVQTAVWKKGDLDSESVGFVIGPRINAAGRMEHAYLAVDLLMEERAEEAVTKATLLEEVNHNRQKATEKLMEQAKEMVQDHEEHSIVLAWSEQWSPALVGLAAGRYADLYGKPAIFIGKYGKNWIGSGRSIPSYNITAAVREAGEGLLLRYGGHAQACGFTLEGMENLERFVEALRVHAKSKLAEDHIQPILEIEAELGLEELDWNLLETIRKFEPFGECNPKPLFISKNLRVGECSFVGAQQNHVRCVLLSERGRRQKFMGFYRSDLKPIMVPGARVDVVYEIGESEWNGRKEIQCKIVDARPS